MLFIFPLKVILFLDEQLWYWQTLDKTVSLPMIPDGGIKMLKNEYDLCLTGEVRFTRSCTRHNCTICLQSLCMKMTMIMMVMMVMMWW